MLYYYYCTSDPCRIALDFNRATDGGEEDDDNDEKRRPVFLFLRLNADDAEIDVLDGQRYDRVVSLSPSQVTGRVGSVRYYYISHEVPMSTRVRNTGCYFYCKIQYIALFFVDNDIVRVCIRYTSFFVQHCGPRDK